MLMIISQELAARCHCFAMIIGDSGVGAVQSDEGQLYTARHFVKGFSYQPLNIVFKLAASIDIVMY